MTKTFQGSGQYTLPGPTGNPTLAEYIDALYIDDIFFKLNIPITGATLVVSSTRGISGDLGLATSTIFIVTYSGGVVGTEMVGGGMWNLGDDGPITFTTDLTGILFGIGVNILDIRLSRNFALAKPMVFGVGYTLEVSY